jgi:hypothetical protein
MDFVPGIPRLLTAREVERALHVRQGTCRYLVSVGALAPVPLPGRHPRFTVEAVRRAIGLAPEPPRREASSKREPSKRGADAEANRQASAQASR